ncbi:MAG: cytochrome c biogenesis protein CcsA [Sandaracinaceae bacterium]
MSTLPAPRFAGSPRPPPALVGLAALTALLVGVSLWLIFVVAPVEARMGIVQKIFYFHVPSAYAMYLGFGLCGIGSSVYLLRRRGRWDALAVAGAEVGLLFALIVLTTGPMWARKAWGVWWTWDPRLTTTLLAAMIFTAYAVLRSSGAAGEAEKRFASALAIVGMFMLPVIHFSVQQWRGTHPQVISRGGGGLHPDMVPALIVGFVTFTCLTALLVWTRMRAERTAEELSALEREAAEQGLLD